jgi:hypothetical protein
MISYRALKLHDRDGQDAHPTRVLKIWLCKNERLLAYQIRLYNPPYLLISSYSLLERTLCLEW